MGRIVSLIPSATEIICTLGFESQLVGRSHECDFPLSVRSLPVVTAPSFSPEGTSLEIDKQVKSLLERALSIYRVDTALLESLSPDVIVTQAQCDVCAVSLKDVEQAVCGFMGKRPHLVSLVPNSLADVWGDIDRVASALEAVEKGRHLVDKLNLRLKEISLLTGNLPHPTVACIEWIEPLMAAGNWMPELVTIAGGQNLFGEAGKHSPWMKPEELWRADPDVIVILPCGFAIRRSREELPSLTNLPQWKHLRAVQNGRVFVTDGNQYFNRPGPRLVDSAEILAEIFHGLGHRHEGTGWVTL